jgi:alkylation response protein AidB-like acyl-CoA dehydrogenase
MNFGFDDTQLALRDMARDLFAKESPPSRLRALWDGKPFERHIWRKMAEVGICGLTVPEAYGGAGGDEIDLTLVYEEAGRAALPEPLLETTGIAAPLITELGTDAERDRWLPKIAQGEALAAVRIPEQTHVPWAAEADLLVWWCDDGRGVHFLGNDSFTAVPTEPFYATRPIARVHATPTDTTRRDVVAAPGRGSFGVAAFLNGLSMGVLEMTTEYVKNRKQFGRSVGSFQAVKHKLASIHIAIECARPAAWYAGYAIATGAPDASEAAAVAQVVAIEAEKLCNREALQCHGGIGFTWEHDLHIRLKRGILLRSEFGGLAGATEALRGTVIDKLVGTI